MGTIWIQTLSTVDECNEWWWCGDGRNDDDFLGGGWDCGFSCMRW